MKRQAIRGFTWKAFGWRIEFVTINHLLRIVAIYDNKNISCIKRFEW